MDEERKLAGFNDKKPRLVVLYKQGQAEKPRMILSNRFLVAIKPTNTIKRQLCYQKDPIFFSQQSGVVYYYQCADCPEQYKGETGRPKEEREKEHNRHVRGWILERVQ